MSTNTSVTTIATTSTESLKDIINSTTKASSDINISNAQKTTKVLSDTSISKAPQAQNVPETSSTSSPTSSALNTFTKPVPVATSVVAPASVATVPVATSVSVVAPAIVPVAEPVATSAPVSAPITTLTETSSDNNINNQIVNTKYNKTITNIKKTFNTKNKNKFFLIILIFIFVIYFIGLYTLLTSKNKYDNLYNCKSDKFIIEINLTLTYLQIVISMILLYMNKKFISYLFSDKYNNLSTVIVLFALIYFIYIISVMQLTYILINIDNYKEIEYYSLTKYYIFIQSLQCILLLYYIYKNF